jgi:hypothetical protein
MAMDEVAVLFKGQVNFKHHKKNSLALKFIKPVTHMVTLKV